MRTAKYFEKKKLKTIYTWQYNKIYVQKDLKVTHLNKFTENLEENGYCTCMAIIGINKYIFSIKIESKSLSVK